MTPTTTTFFKQSGLEWLGSAPITWKGRVFSTIDKGELLELSLWLDSICIRAARLKGYINARITPNASYSHEEAVRQSNKEANRIRRALGHKRQENLKF